MKATIHRGTNEIGGSCVEVVSGTSRILIDAGMPLTGESGSLPPGTKTLDAVFISHPHCDHFGLIDQLPPEVPLYIGRLAQKLIQATRLFLGQKLFKNSFFNFESWQSIEIGSNLRVKPYPVDHSAAGAYGFSIEADGKSLFYSGDFRAHGRKQKLFEHILERPPQNVDVMLMEGTMLDRVDSKFPDEESVENKIVEILENEDGPCFLLSSSQNIDRIVSAYRAAKRTRRIFVVDIYTACILRELAQFSKHTPRIDWNDIRVLSRGWTARNHYLKVKENPEVFEGFIYELYKKDNVITHDELANEQNRYFIKNNYVGGLIKELDCKHASVIYSMWNGLLTKEHNPGGCRRLQALKDNKNINFVYAHTGGHAVLADLKRFADAINPKVIVPIHTKHKDKYQEYFDQEIKVVEDGEPFFV